VPEVLSSVVTVPTLAQFTALFKLTVIKFPADRADVTGVLHISPLAKEKAEVAPASLVHVFPPGSLMLEISCPAGAPKINLRTAL
jgi:hypothetical protein